MSTTINAGSEIIKNVQDSTNVMESKDLSQNVEKEYGEVKDRYPQINKQVEVAKEKGLQDNATLFQNTAVQHSHKMDSEYGKNAESKERKSKERYFDGVVSKVCKWINDHPKMVKAIKIGSTAAAAACGVAATAFPPAAMGAVAFGAVAGAFEAAQQFADKRKLGLIEKKVEALSVKPESKEKVETDELTALKSKIEAQEKALNDLEQKINKGIGESPKPLEADTKSHIEKQSPLSFVDKEAMKNLPTEMINAIKTTNNEMIATEDPTFKKSAEGQNKDIASLASQNHTH